MSALSGPEEAIVALIKLLRGRPQGNSVELISRARLRLVRYTYPARTKDIVYQNTSSAQRLCMITCWAQAPALGTDTGASCAAFVGTTDPPTDNVGATGLSAATRVNEESVTAIMTFMVDVGEYYKLVSYTAGGGTIVTPEWVEVDFVI